MNSIRFLAFALLSACGGNVGDAVVTPEPAPPPLPPLAVPTGPIAYGSIITSIVGDAKDITRIHPSVVAHLSPAKIQPGLDTIGQHCAPILEVGSCSVMQCTGVVPPVPNAGPIRATERSDMVTLEPQPKWGILQGAFPNRDYFSAGTSVAIDGDGSAELGPIHGTITIPPALEVKDFETLHPIVRSKGVVVRWTPIDADVMVVVRQDAPIACRFEGSTGTGTIESAALSRLVAKRSADISVWSAKQTTVLAGTVPVRLVGTNSLNVMFVGVE